MIYYLTNQTIDRYTPTLVETLDAEDPAVKTYHQQAGDALLEWGGKIMYFDRRKCIQLCNFASRFTLFLIDRKKSDLLSITNLVAFYLSDIYANDLPMLHCLMAYFSQAQADCFAPLKNRSIISTLNTTQRMFAGDGYYFYNYFEGNILKTREINRAVNFDYPVSKIVDNKRDYYYPGEKFRAMLLARYGNA